ncbi:carboxypeptidase M32 [Rhodobaculum claviforme]|uniref:Metal-dependent carboxypeptidase n=1 Tax=Rhodobaculum claviforme TaxID=1549854 RepID=A0A934TDL5_9RHOB|nr:carboxypeptidase M32 [Rhodobaculum claviforme]MBK5925804.1 carboxypeptidase M32 [Rhodobaculum claviforme]
MTAFDDLMAHQRDTEALGQILGRLHWDQEAMMPRGASVQRSEEIAALTAVLHARRTDPRMADWLAQAEAPDDAGAAALRLIARAHARATRVPGRLASEIARATSIAQGVWAEARARDEPALFLPSLAEVLDLKREEAAALAQGTDTAPYDVLIDDFEPGATAQGIGAIFDRMRPRLVALRAAVIDAPHQPPTLRGHFDRTAQMRLAREMAGVFGYDFAHGRIDEVVHPFCSGGGQDVRITTRTAEDDPFNCLYSTIHETGHAAYEQSIAPEYRLTPLGHGASMGVHESQARMYENQLGRSRAFCGWLHDRMTAEFGDLGLGGADGFYGAVNRINPGHIRTEADEVQYNLHIMLRFDLERALVAGDLAVADLECAWNDRFEADFGYGVPRASLGMLQDVHWSLGLFGYFPTYALGNVYAGCLHAALLRDVPDLDTHLGAGDPGPATDWLRTHLQVHGGLRTAGDTIRHAIGTDPDEGPLLDYLEAKFSALYRL